MATLIYDVNDLQDIELDLTADYELANDIDASGVPFTPISYFTGTLDGKEYTINGLNMALNGAGMQYAAFMERSSGTIRNVGLTNVDISCTSTTWGAASSGFCYRNDGIIEKCYVTGIVEAHNAGTRSCNATGFCYVNNGTISNCYSTASTTADSSAGDDGTASGFVDSNTSTINECYSTGNVTAKGGIGLTNHAIAAGFCTTNIKTIINCYTTSAISLSAGASKSGGGFVCALSNPGIITNSYSTGFVPPNGGSFYTGGFSYTGSGIATKCYWDTQTSGHSTSSHGTGKTTAEMKTKSTFSGWNFSSIWSITPFCNNGYPCLQNVTPNCALIPSIQGPQTKEIISLQAMREIEMSCMGRVYIDEEGNLTYESRYARNP